MRDADSPTSALIATAQEYDRQYGNIEPFLALPGSVMRERAALLADPDPSRRWHRTSFTVQIRNGSVGSVTGPGAYTERAEDQLLLLSHFVHHLPDMKCVEHAASDGH